MPVGRGFLSAWGASTDWNNRWFNSFGYFLIPTKCMENTQKEMLRNDKLLHNCCDTPIFYMFFLTERGMYAFNLGNQWETPRYPPDNCGHCCQRAWCGYDCRGTPWNPASTAKSIGTNIWSCPAFQRYVSKMQGEPHKEVKENISLQFSNHIRDR